MRKLTYTTALCLCLGTLPVILATGGPAFADDRSYLTAFLEDNLSGAGRKVTITGFAGALSSRATMQKLTIADDQGVWLELQNVVIDWSRTALFSGQIIVNELSADRIILARLPQTDPDTPSPEATAFALPDLPVSVDIGAIKAAEISLGASVLGQEILASLAADLHLADGEGRGKLLLERTDSGPEGRIALAGSFANDTGHLILDLEAVEAAGGLVATGLDLPGAPAASLSLKGEGRLDDFSALFRLESDGDERLSGPIRIQAGEEAGDRQFSADLNGNPAPLFLPEYAEFLGEALHLKVQGESKADGRLYLHELDLGARALTLTGKVELAADGLPTLLDVKGNIALPDGSPVLLPISGPAETRIQRADLRLGFDARQGDGWRLDLALKGLQRPDITMAEVGLTGSGRLDRRQGRRSLGGTLRFNASEIGGLDPALIAAIGRDLGGRAVFSLREGEAGLRLPQIELSGADYGATGRLEISGLDDVFTTRGEITLSAQDLSRFSGLAGRDLAGNAAITLSGSASPLTGAMDLVAEVDGNGLKTGIAEADRMLAGRVAAKASVLRDENGTQLRALSAQAASLSLEASGMLASTGSDLQGRIDFADLSNLGPTYGGRLGAEARFSGTPENGRLTLRGEAQDLRVGQPDLDRLNAGRSDISLQLDMVEGRARLSDLSLTGPNVTATVAESGENGRLDVSGRLRDLGLLAPDFPGSVTLAGNVTPVNGEYVADLRVQGPAGIDARLNGQVTGTPDLSISGTTQAQLANGLVDPVSLTGTVAYDLRLAGGWTPANVNGRATLSNGSVAIPARGLALERVALAADLAGGTVTLSSTAELPRGGSLRLNGPIAMSAPYAGNLEISVNGINLRDPELYETSLTGDLRLNGPLMGNALLAGVITLGETELRVPSTGFSTGADLEKVRHIKDTAPVRATRAKAGIGVSGGADTSGGGSSLNWGLDLTINAPQRVFVRGRGLDAELGGSVHLGGSLSRIIPSGSLDLIRGRLDILGQRLTLDEASLILEGDFIPYLSVSASNNSQEVRSIVSITGPANDPQVTFSSDPELPQEEVLAWLLFGRGLESISAFQAAQLANAVATLAGKGGEGIVGKLRKGFGFDDLDVSTDETGSTSVKAGKYIADNIYTELGVDQEGRTRINLNLDLRKGLTVKGRVDSDGSSGIGLFLEKDY